MKRGILPRNLSGIVIVGVILLAAATLLEASDSSTVAYGENSNVTAFTVCKKVTNSSATGLSVYIPTQSAEEWTSFYTNPPAGVATSSCSTPGSETFTSPGTFDFTVPEYTTLTVTAGGGGGGSTQPTSGWSTRSPLPGGDSSFLTVLGAGGYYGWQGGGGWGGVGSGGDSNANGGNGVNNGPGGAPGGYGAGTGGAGRAYCVKSGCYYAYGGGGGGWAEKTFVPGQLTPGSVVTVTVGGGGQSGCGCVTSSCASACGNWGTDGSVVISWQ